MRALHDNTIDPDNMPLPAAGADAGAACRPAAGTVRVYVTNSAGDSIDVIDPVSNKVVQKIKDIVGAHGIAFSPDALARLCEQRRDLRRSTCSTARAAS